MGSYQIDIQSFNGTWTSDVTSTAYEAYILIAGIEDAAQVEVNNINVSSQEALDKWYAGETKPAEVDMGGDFEGFIEAVNGVQDGQEYISELRAKFEQATEYAMNEWGHMPLTFAEFCEAEAIEDDSIRAAIYEGDIAIQDYRQSQTVSPAAQPETPRIKRLRAQIARAERELEDLRFELAQLLEDNHV